MRNQTPNRTEYIPRVRLTPSEKEQVLREYDQTYHKTIAAFVREKLLNGDISHFQKKKIDALFEVGALQTDIARVGNNINQIAKALNTYKQGELRSEELHLMHELIPLFHEVINALNKVRL